MHSQSWRNRPRPCRGRAPRSSSECLKAKSVSILSVSRSLPNPTPAEELAIRRNVISVGSRRVGFTFSGFFSSLCIVRNRNEFSMPFRIPWVRLVADNLARRRTRTDFVFLFFFLPSFHQLCLEDEFWRYLHRRILGLRDIAQY